MEEAQHDRAAIQTVGESFSRRFVPASFLLSAATLLVTHDLVHLPRMHGVVNLVDGTLVDTVSAAA